MSSRVTFTGGRFHRYSLDGDWVPSVTSVTGKVGDKGGLVGGAAKEVAAWAAIHVDELPQLGEAEWRKAASGSYRRAWDAARDHGTLVHTLAESLVYGHPLPAEDEAGLPWPDDAYASAQQLASFMDAWQVDPVAHEAAVYHETDRWAGRLDLIADMSGGRWLLDYKTGASGIWPETSLQLAAYAHATHIVRNGDDWPMPHIDRAAAVWVRPSDWQLIPVAIGDAVYDVFRHAMHVAAWAKLDRDQSVGAPLPVPEVA
jgi:hypothetical protein